jgi:hypothetical protein
MVGYGTAPMDGLLALHVASAAATVGMSATVCVWGMVRARRLRPLEGQPPPPRPPARDLFPHVLLFSQLAVFFTGMLGLMMLAGHRHPHDPLHVRVYGPFMAVAVVAAWGFRTPDASWNTRVFAVAAFFVTLLGVRAFMTG